MPKVRVPKELGDEIIVTPGTTMNPVTYKVVDGTVSVKQSDLEAFLRDVAGAQADGVTAAEEPQAEAPPSAPAKE